MCFGCKSCGRRARSSRSAIGVRIAIHGYSASFDPSSAPNNNSRSCDTAVGTEFETILRVKIPAAAKMPIFGPDNQLLPGVEDTDTVFRKRIPAGAIVTSVG
jgi:hypothetical protein